MNHKNLKLFVAGYIECALWAESFDEYFLSKEGEETLTAQATAFFEKHEQLLGEFNEERVKVGASDWASAGHDFLLTRNGHGCGFWDREAGESGDKLTELVGFGTEFGEIYLYIGDDGLVYVSG